ncbi:magnesium transporter NIPA [Actinocorallia herbida]|uniref:Magnesium transporter NIPA n=1 Tax=Actinocorallia herbida TaxID=58109 RepID=A0A3N1CZH5_9ACTN|nr:DMT family transporter [Actinocorallia herbida]ROO86669.1 magnesium transporter NIPA [Actinocorallia herbida]
MEGTGLGWAFLAVAGTCVYFASFLLFQRAARRMPPLRGSRPIHTTMSMLSDPVWFTGGLLLFVGLAGQIVTFAMLPSNIAQPLLGFSLLLLLAYAAVVLRERLSRREWTMAALAVLAVVLLGLSGRSSAADLNTTDAWFPAPLILVIVPPAAIAGLVWLVGDRKAGGRHGRPLAGVAYGLSAGFCAGIAEAGARGIAAIWSVERSVAGVVSSPYPLLILGMAGVTLIQLQVALQRCRLIVVAVLIAVSGRTAVVLSSTVLYDETWPSDTGGTSLRWTGFALAVLAVLAFPRHEQNGTALAARRGAARKKILTPAVRARLAALLTEDPPTAFPGDTVPPAARDGSGPEPRFRPEPPGPPAHRTRRTEGTQPSLPIRSRKDLP